MLNALLLRKLSTRHSLVLIRQWFCLLGLVLASGLALASESESNVHPGPQEVVQHLTDELLMLVEEHRDTFGDDPESFHEALSVLMEPVVAFRYIAKNVMGSKYYKQASKEQFARFEENFRGGLVRTYAKGFFTYNGEEVIVHAPEEDITTNKKVTVVQEIKTDGGVEIAYTMGKNKSGQWKLLNMVVNGVNLGTTLRNQFQHAMEKSGDLDEVIDSWSLQVQSDKASDVEESGGE